MSRIYHSPCPCHHCEKQGCGSHHDKCEKFKNWKDNSEPEVKKAFHKNKIGGKYKNYDY